jgi:hypothetical protein
MEVVVAALEGGSLPLNHRLSQNLYQMKGNEGDILGGCTGVRPVATVAAACAVDAVGGVFGDNG